MRKRVWRCSRKPPALEAEQLCDLARRVANRTGYRQVLVLGSQAVHGALPDEQLPAITTMSQEADLLIPSDTTGETAHEIEAGFGMGSPYHQHFGVYADGIARSEVALPAGWEGRLRTMEVADVDADNPVTVYFPEIHDLCASKLTVAVTGGFGRRSDREFVAALVAAGHVDTAVLAERIDALPEDQVPPAVRARAHEIISAL